MGSRQIAGGRSTSWLPSIEKQNIYFTAFATSAVAWVGSLLTVLVVLSILWATVSLPQRHFAFNIERHQVPFVTMATIFAVLGFAMVRFHAGKPIGIDGLEYLVFLAPLLLLARFQVGPSKEDFRAIVKQGLAAAGILAGAVAACQFLYWGARAEGAAGNPLAFATVSTLAGLGAMILLIEPDRRHDRLLGMFGWTGAVIAVTLSQSRTMIVVLLSCSFLFAALSWRELLRGYSRSFLILLASVAIIASGSAASVVVDRMSADVPVAETEQVAPTSAGWRGIYLEAGWRVASKSLLFGVGRSERAHLVGLELEAMGFPTKLEDEITYTSWHRFLPEFARPAVVNWQLKRWERQRSSVQSGGGPSENPPAAPNIAATSKERISSPHSHLHNAYMTMLVDHGVVGLTSLLTILSGPIIVALWMGLHRSDPVFLKFYVAMVLALSLAGATNVHIENDIIASYFVVLSVLFWRVVRTQPQA
ncbi:MAG: O-antigen ligase family protein [Pseudomonadota bacterium]